MSQTDQLAVHLKAGKAITPIEALERWGCFRLAARIGDLRQQGWQIITEKAERGGKTFARYRLI